MYFKTKEHFSKDETHKISIHLVLNFQSKKKTFFFVFTNDTYTAKYTWYKITIYILETFINYTFNAKKQNLHINMKKQEQPKN